MDRFRMWQGWLLVVGGLIVGFGAFLVILGGTSLLDAFRAPFWGSDPPGAADRAFQGWTFGILGATMAGWGVFVLFVTRYAFAQREPWAWQAILVGVVVWFATDSAISAMYGVYANVLVNSVFLVLVAAPIYFTRSEFPRVPRDR